MKEKINLKPYIIAGIISFVLGVFIFILIFIILKKPAVDGLAFGALALLASSGLIWIAREGFFDIFSYGFKQLGNSMFSKKPNEFNNYSEYRIAKNEVREKRSKYYISVAIVGAFFLLATLIVFLVLR